MTRGASVQFLPPKFILRSFKANSTAPMGVSFLAFINVMSHFATIATLNTAMRIERTSSRKVAWLMAVSAHLVFVVPAVNRLVLLHYEGQLGNQV